jgi:hypothetical protein
MVVELNFRPTDYQRKPLGITSPAKSFVSTL